MTEKHLKTNTLNEIATFIWEEQNKLNAVCHPLKKGTIQINTDGNRLTRREVFEDFSFALSSEVNELIENRFWKHWSKEAKDGKRWHLTNEEGTGEGTVQNERLESIDLLFFLVSIMHLLDHGYTSWYSVFTDSESWITVEEAPSSPIIGRKIAVSAQQLLSTVTDGLRNSHRTNINFNAQESLSRLIKIFSFLGMSPEDVLSLYKQKLQINYDRMKRGRKQVGDEHADTENASVT